MRLAAQGGNMACAIGDVTGCHLKRATPTGWVPATAVERRGSKAVG